jgi:hypothetical protein
VGQRITKRVVDGLKPRATEYAVWDAQLPGFGVRVRPTGTMSYIVVYRAGAGRGAPVRRYTIAAVGKIAPEAARRQAKAILGKVAHGRDPAGERASERGTPSVSELCDRFMADHIQPKRKPGTAVFYHDVLNRIIKVELGSSKADKVTRPRVTKVHARLRNTPFQANRVLAALSSMYAFAGRAGAVPEGMNPARGIAKFKESRRERFLTGKELERLGKAIREAENKGLGRWMKLARMPSICPRPRNASPKSLRPQRRHCGCCCLRAAAFAKSFISNGRMIWSAGCSSYRTARPDERP